MIKISPIASNTLTSLKSSKTQSKKVISKATERAAEKAKPVIDCSTEELGFFMVNGKAIKTFFPR